MYCAGTGDVSPPAVAGRGRMWAAGLLGLLAPLAPAAASAQSPYSVEDILSAPFATDLIAAPTGAAFAWVRYDRGVRNIWIAEGPEYVGRQLTNWTEDDGQDLSQLRFTPDGRQVLFVRGGGPNRAGEIPNPRSDPEPATQMVWVAGLDGASRPLAEGGSPAISPDGRTIAFLNRGQIFTLTLDGSAPPGPLLRIRGSAGSLAWSPDGGRLAFVSNRGDHTFVGVFSLDEGEVRYLDPSLDRDGSPTWSPDGTALAFIRVPNEGAQLPFTPLRSALPWSIRLADAATGEAREVWRAAPGRGSAFQAMTGPSLIWLASDRLVFPWEREGWHQLYSVPVAGGAATHLTPGEFEVESVLPAPDGASVYYVSNADDIDRRHVWRVTADGEPEALTSGNGIEWNPAVTPDGALAYLATDGRTPAHAELDAGRRAASAGRRVHARRLPVRKPRGAAAGDVRVRGWDPDPWATLPSAPVGGGRTPPGGGLLPRRVAAADAPRLALHALLPQRVRPQPVPGEPRLRRALRELSQRHRLRAGVQGGAELRRPGRERVP